MDTPPLSSASERRTEFRKPLRTRVVLAFPDKRPLEGRAFDIGPGGLGVVADLSLPIGATCTLQFSLLFKDGSNFNGKTSARVAYCVLSSMHNGFKVGLQFANMSEAVAMAVTRYLDG